MEEIVNLLVLCFTLLILSGAIMSGLISSKNIPRFIRGLFVGLSLGMVISSIDIIGEYRIISMLLSVVSTYISILWVKMDDIYL